MTAQINLDEVLQTFVAQNQELLLLMEDAPLQIEQAPDDIDTINALFRGAHTFKGSAGLFGLTSIVVFTHVAEATSSLGRLVEEVRDSTLTLSGRGAGMDVVNRNIVALRVSLSLESVETMGTQVRIRNWARSLALN